MPPTAVLVREAEALDQLNRDARDAETPRWTSRPKLPAASLSADIGVVRDNARQLKFKSESTGFED